MADLPALPCAPRSDGADAVAPVVTKGAKHAVAVWRRVRLPIAPVPRPSFLNPMLLAGTRKAEHLPRGGADAPARSPRRTRCDGGAGAAGQPNHSLGCGIGTKRPPPVLPMLNPKTIMNSAISPTATMLPM